MKWLFKEEPTHYSFDDLIRDGRTAWTGVRNPLAQKHLRSVQKGDLIFLYHTGDVKAIVGIAKAAGPPYPDPAEKTGKLYSVDVVPVKLLKSPVTLAAVKADKTFASFPLVRIPRLSVEIDDEHFIVGMAGIYERQRRGNDIRPFLLHAAAVVDHQADRGRCILGLEQVYGLFPAVLVDMEIFCC